MRVRTLLRRVAAASVIPVLGWAPLSSSPVEAAGSCTAYSVRTGDGWFAIADRVDVDVSSLLAANGAGLDDPLSPGDRLCLPDGADLVAGCERTATVRAGDGWSSIADRIGVGTGELLAVNAATERTVIHPGQEVCLPPGFAGASRSEPSVGAAYVVRTGDSWFWIAERSEVSVGALLAANDATSDRALFPGQELRLPAGATVPSGATQSGARSGTVALDALPTQGPCWYHDTWGDARSGGRTHVGTDIFTVPGEHVYAVADGVLTSRTWAQPGNISGNAWRLTAADGTSFFYAHLADFAPGLSEGSRVEQGQIIGWVGSTGNTTVSHLHFEVHPSGDDPVNPYPILRSAGGACNAGKPYTQPGGWVPD